MIIATFTAAHDCLFAALGNSGSIVRDVLLGNAMQSNKVLLTKMKEKKQGLRDDNNRTDTMRHFHDSEMSQPVIVNTIEERMFGGCEDMDACCPGSHKAKQLEEDAFFFF